MMTMRGVGRITALRLFACLIFVVAGAFVASAQDNWPSRTVRIVAPWPPGGSADIVARLLADSLAKTLHETFIVDNRPGASGMIGSAAVAHADPDGYTFLISGMPSQVIAPAVNDAAGFDAVKSFSHIAFIGGAPVVLVAHASLGVHSLAEFVASLKEREEPMPYVSPGVGSLGNLVVEVLARREGVKLVHVPYKGGTQAATDLLAGAVKVGAITWSAAQNYIRAGVVVPLAVTSSHRIPGFDAVPTFKELGYDELTSTAWWGFSAPANLPFPITRTLNEEIIKAIASPPIQEKLSQQSILTETMSASQFTSFVGDEIRKWTPEIKSVMATAQ
jgi:tripartite-type tricarboxylate transporter receptor subunit TctC